MKNSRMFRPVVARSLALGLLLAACTSSTPPAEVVPVKQEPKAAAVDPAKPALPDAETLLAEAVDAMGGAEKFAALKTFYSESKMDMAGLGLTGVAKTWWRGGDFYNEADMPGIGQIRIGSLGGKPWGDDPISGRRALTDKEAEQALWSATLCIAYDWKRFFKKAETTAVTEVDGKKLAEVTFTSPLGDTVVLRIDLESKLPVSESFTQASPLGSSPVTVHFKDFREVGGLKIPHEQLADTSLTKIASTVTKLELNVVIDEAKFEMPEGKAAVVPGALTDGAKVVPPAEGKAPEPAKGDKKKDKKSAAP